MMLGGGLALDTILSQIYKTEDKLETETTSLIISKEHAQRIWMNKYGTCQKTGQEFRNIWKCELHLLTE